jgi:roadblock/LC7 domain-containing protein
MQARGWEQLTGAQGFYPIEGISFVGFEWSVVSRGRFGVILDNHLANYEGAFAALAGRGVP